MKGYYTTKLTPTFISVFILLATGIFAQDKNSTANTALSYKHVSFDSDTCCWRKLYANMNYLGAANLIVSYINFNKPANKHSLNWHAGQMFAMAHSDDLAKKYFKKTYSIFYKWFGSSDTRTWYYYAKGTVAFINNDKKALEKIIKNWDKKFPADNNYKVLVKLNENWGKGYEVALRTD